ncbi:MAG TPA: hypothetical protein VN361_08255 [Oxalicibacterium sp.]|nr:hypothetical protein [Oxalicibacterium sp.]
MLETICEAAMLTTQTLSHWLTEKIADRFGRSETLLRRITIQALVFGLLVFPMMIAIPCTLALALYGLRWLFGNT